MLNLKLIIMKKIFVIAFTAMSLVACNDADKTTETEITKDTSKQSVEPTPSGTTYAPADGDVIYRENKVYVMRNGNWAEADNDIKFDNGVTVYRNGRVVRNDMEIELRDGEIVNRTGDFLDRSGNAIDNAWEATKEGTKDAGRAVKRTAKKVGEKIGNVVDSIRR